MKRGDLITRENRHLLRPGDICLATHLSNPAVNGLCLLLRQDPARTSNWLAVWLVKEGNRRQDTAVFSSVFGQDAYYRDAYYARAVHLQNTFVAITELGTVKVTAVLEIDNDDEIADQEITVEWTS